MRRSAAVDAHWVAGLAGQCIKIGAEGAAASASGLRPLRGTRSHADTRVCAWTAGSQGLTRCRD